MSKYQLDDNVRDSLTYQERTELFAPGLEVERIAAIVRQSLHLFLDAETDVGESIHDGKSIESREMVESTRKRR